MRNRHRMQKLNDSDDDHDDRDDLLNGNTNINARIRDRGRDRGAGMTMMTSSPRVVMAMNAVRNMSMNTDGIGSSGGSDGSGSGSGIEGNTKDEYKLQQQRAKQRANKHKSILYRQHQQKQKKQQLQHHQQQQNNNNSFHDSDNDENEIVLSLLSTVNSDNIQMYAPTKGEGNDDDVENNTYYNNAIDTVDTIDEKIQMMKDPFSFQNDYKYPTKTLEQSDIHSHSHLVGRKPLKERPRVRSHSSGRKTDHQRNHTGTGTAANSRKSIARPRPISSRSKSTPIQIQPLPLPSSLRSSSSPVVAPTLSSPESSSPSSSPSSPPKITSTMPNNRQNYNASTRRSISKNSSGAISSSTTSSRNSRSSTRSRESHLSPSLPVQQSSTSNTNTMSMSSTFHQPYQPHTSLSPSSTSSSNIIPPLPRLSRGLPSFQHPTSSSSLPPPPLSTSKSYLSSSSSTTASAAASQAGIGIGIGIGTATPTDPLCTWMNKPPRSNWNISDNKLKPIPPLHPPIPPNNRIFIVDSSPSIVACRISSCLRQRSIIVDYDDDAAMATCWSKGDNGSGEGELVLYGTDSVIHEDDTNDDNGGGGNGATTTNNNFESSGGGEDFLRDYYYYGNNGNTLTGNSYGGGGGCVVFTIHLYRGSKHGEMSVSGGNINVTNNNSMSSRHGPSQHGGTSRKNDISSLADNSILPSLAASYGRPNDDHHATKPDFSHGIIVECMRIRGDSIQFHKDCRAIFASAKGNSDGLDDYRSSKSSLYHSPFCFKKLRPISLLTRDNHQLFVNNNNTIDGGLDGDSDEYNIEDEYDDTDNSIFEQDGEESHPNLLQMKFKRTTSELTNSTFSALERVLDLLDKNRFDAQLLGVKSLLLLTDMRSSGLECSYMTSLCILGSKMRFSYPNPNLNPNPSSNSSNGKHGNDRSRYRRPTSDFSGAQYNGGGRNGEGYCSGADLFCNTSWTAEQLHNKVLSIAKGTFLPSSRTNYSYNSGFGEEHDEEEDGNEDDDSFLENPYYDSYRGNKSNPASSIDEKQNTMESQYNATIRGYMTHVLSNALHNLIQNSDQFPLLPQPTCAEFMSKDFIEKLLEDVAGATRPPMALLGTAHEATHAVKFLHLLASYSEAGFRAVHSACIGDGPMIVKKRPIMELLDKAYGVGLSSHHVLKLESKIARDALTGSM